MVQFDGKWPFTRIFGIQEVFSSFFSLLNLLPHAYNFFLKPQYYELAPEPLRFSLMVYSISAINVWIWSTVFHARDNLWTMRLDYHCAFLGLLTAWSAMTVRVFRINSKLAVLLLYLFITAVFVGNVSYLNLVKFDFRLNMVMSAAVVASHSVLWILWASSMLLWSANRKRRRYLWKCIAVCILLPGLGVGLELMDFPPVWHRMLDAHAVWHGLTPFLGVLWYQFWHAEVEYMTSLEPVLPTAEYMMCGPTRELTKRD